jgi:hypothetical protein
MMKQEPIDVYALAEEVVRGDVRDWMVAGAEAYSGGPLQPVTSLYPHLVLPANPSVVSASMALPPPPDHSPDDGERQTARLWFSDKDEFTTEAVAGIIHALQFVGRPIAFTITGNSSGIVHWLAAHPDDMPALAHLFHASFSLSHLDANPICTYDDCLKQCAPDSLGYRTLLPPLPFWHLIEGSGLDFGPIYSAMANLRKDERAVYQVVFASMPHEWCSAVRRMAAAETITADGLRDHRGWAFSSELAKKVHAKVNGPLFCAAVRMGILGCTPNRRTAVMGSLRLGVSGLLFTGGPLRLVTEDDCSRAGISKEQLVQGFIDGRVHHHGAVVSAKELALLVQLPGMRSLANKHLPLDRAPLLIGNMAGEKGLLLGTEFVYGRELPVVWPHATRCLSMMVGGASGFGKTMFIAASVARLLNENPSEGACVIDPHDTAIERILLFLDDARLDDCILHSPMDDDYILCLPLFTCEAVEEMDATVSNITRQICSLFAKSELGFNIMRGIRNVVRTVLLCPNVSFVEARKLLEPSSRGAALRERVCAQIDDEFLTDYWENGYTELDGASIGRIESRIDHLLEPKRLRRQLANRIRKLTYKQIIDEGKILLASTAPGNAGVEGVDIIGSLHLTGIHSAAHIRAGRPGERSIFTDIVDEFGNYMNPRTVPHSLRTLRKCDISQILVTQNVDSLADEIKTAMGNINTHVAFLQGWEDAQVYFRAFGGVIPTTDLMARDVGEAFVKIGKRLASVRCPKPEEKRTIAIVQEVLEQTRRKYCISVKEFRERMIDEHHVSIEQMKDMDLL